MPFVAVLTSLFAFSAVHAAASPVKITVSPERAVEAYETSQLNSSRLPKVNEKFELKSKDDDDDEKKVEIYVYMVRTFEISEKDGCTSLKTNDSEPWSGGRAGSVSVSYCTGENIRTPDDQLAFDGMADFVLPSYDGQILSTVEALVKFRSARTGKVYLMTPAQADRALVSVRQLRKTGQLTAGGENANTHVADLIVPSLAYSRARMNAKKNLVQLCAYFGGEIAGAIEYKNGSFSGLDMKAHASATAACKTR